MKLPQNATRSEDIAKTARLVASIYHLWQANQDYLDGEWVKLPDVCHPRSHLELASYAYRYEQECDNTEFQCGAGEGPALYLHILKAFQGISSSLLVCRDLLHLSLPWREYDSNVMLCSNAESIWLALTQFISKAMFLLRPLQRCHEMISDFRLPGSDSSDCISPWQVLLVVRRSSCDLLNGLGNPTPAHSCLLTPATWVRRCRARGWSSSETPLWGSNSGLWASLWRPGAWSMSTFLDTLSGLRGTMPPLWCMVCNSLLAQSKLLAWQMYTLIIHERFCSQSYIFPTVIYKMFAACPNLSARQQDWLQAAS